MIKLIKNNTPEISFILGTFILVIIFLFNPHYIEQTATLETWFPYQGLVPYKDFVMFHFPLGRALIYPLHLITDWNLRFDPLLALTIGILNLLAIYFIGKKNFQPLSLFFSCLFFSLCFWYFATGILYFHEMLIGLLTTIFIYLLLSKPKNFFLLGIVLSLTELSGQVASVIVISGGLITTYFIFQTKQKTTGFLKFLLGSLLPLFFVSLYFYKHSALYDFYYWNIPYYLTYSKQTSSLASLPFKPIILFYLPLLFSLTNFSYLPILILAIATIPSNLFSIFHFHHFNASLGILALLFGFLLNSHPKPITKIIIIATFLSGSFLIIIPSYFDKLTFPPQSFTILNDTQPGNSTDTVARWFQSNTPPNTKILVIGDSMLYFRANRLPSTRPSKSIPSSWEPFNLIKPEIISSLGDFWAIDQSFTLRLDKDYHRTNMLNFINETLNNCFQEVFTYHEWQVYSNTHTCKSE